MAGIKGRSGRKSVRDEEKRLRIIEKAWDIVGELLNDSSIPNTIKAQHALKIVSQDLSKPVVFDNSKHQHVTVDLSKLNSQQLLDFILNRNVEPQRQSVEQSTDTSKRF